MKILNIKKILILFVLISNISNGQNKEIKRLCSKGGLEINGERFLNYEYEVLDDRSNIYIYLKKKYKAEKITKIIDSLVVSKKNIPKNFVYTDTGKYIFKGIIYTNLSCIVKKTLKYEGKYYKKIYQAWYFDFEHELIKEIKLPNKNLSALDKSHD